MYRAAVRVQPELGALAIDDVHVVALGAYRRQQIALRQLVLLDVGLGDRHRIQLGHGTTRASHRFELAL
jgi:hypothetical protein